MSQVNGLLSPILQWLRFNKAKKHFKGRNFIDIGCSEGEIIKYLPKNANYTGIKGDRESFKKAKKEHPRYNFINKYLNEKTVRELKIKVQADTIIMLAVLEHLKKPEAVLKGLKKYLKKDGRIIITTPAKKSGDILALGARAGLFSKEAKAEPEKQYTKKELIDLIEKAGYHIEHYEKFELGLNHLVVITKEHEYFKGNIEKHQTKNKILRKLMNKFYKDLLEITNGLNPKTILEVGCGEGMITKRIAEKYSRTKIIGIDINKKAIAYAKKNSAKENINYYTKDLMKIKDQKYDLVIASEVLEHLNNPEKAIKKIKTLTKRDILLSVPNEPIFRIANIARLKYLKKLGNTPGHINHWTKRSFKKIIEKHGKIKTLRTSNLWTIALIRIK